VLVQRGLVGAADCSQVQPGLEVEGGSRSAVMTAVLRQAGLNRYPDIERVSDTLTIVDPRLSHIRAHLAGTEMATDNDDTRGLASLRARATRTDHPFGVPPMLGFRNIDAAIEITRLLNLGR